MQLINIRKFLRHYSCLEKSLFRSDPVSSPTPSHHATPIYMNTHQRTKMPHDVFVYPVHTSTPATAAQQPIHARQR